MLPSPQVLKSLGERFGIPVIRERIFGQDYAKTLAIRRNNFRAAWPNLIRRPVPAAVGILPRLLRGGIPVGNIDVRQVVFAKSK
jgi:cyclopropane-fatty-acyl-phospholipid synthase